ncbi:ComEA family DNA-binding protein [Paenibacillus sp. GYB003]|uniref:ComEA family DNA-binding protein n=1 Tax=Paenibacillus sp. GYB003 TaxID=2994392 RepID=UPI002F96E651
MSTNRRRSWLVAAAIWGSVAALLWTTSALLRGSDTIAEGPRIVRNGDLAELFAGRAPGEAAPPAPDKTANAQPSGSSVPPGSPADAAAAQAQSGSGANATDLNRATAAELDKLPGIGPSKAKAIAEYREREGPFRSIDDLKKVKGIGDKTFESLKPFIKVEPQ